MVGAGLSLNTRGDLGFKQCGSSIANYSDIELPIEPLQEYQGGPFSQESHFVHPVAPGPNNWHPGQVTFRSRDIRGVPAPVFVPQQRIHRVNGYFQDSSRGLAQPGFPPQSSSGNHQRRRSSGALDSVRSAFRNNENKRPGVSQFPVQRGQPDKFEFSRLGSDDGEAHERTSNDMIQHQPNSECFSLSL